MEGLRYLRGRNLTVTVTFSLALLTSGRSRDGVDGPTGETDNLEGGLEDAVEGVVGRPLDLGGAEGGAGDFRDRKGEMLVEDLCDLEEAPDIVEKKKKREGMGEKTERNREKMKLERESQVNVTCRPLPPLVPPSKTPFVFLLPPLNCHT